MTPPDRWVNAKDRAIDVGRFSRFAIRRFFNDRCAQAAAALTYTALLALVPLTTIAVALFSAFPAFENVQQSAQDLIFDNLVPQVGQAVADYLEGFAVNAGRLTSVGLLGLIVTSVMLLWTIEAAFNAIWRVREARPLLIRLLSFWAILTLTPILLAASLSVTNQLLAGSELGDQIPLSRQWVGIAPAVFEWVGFSLLYWIIPNRSVRGRDALIGGFVAAALFELSKSLFALYLAAFPVYETIYGALSTVPIFLLWLYVAWSIVLFGAVVAAALPDWRADKLLGGSYDTLSHGQRLALAVTILKELAKGAREGVDVRRRRLVRRIPVGPPLIDAMLSDLRRTNYVVRSASDRWVLSRDLTSVTLFDLSAALQAGITDICVGMPGTEGEWYGRLSNILSRVTETNRSIMGLSLAEVVAAATADPAKADERQPVLLDEHRDRTAPTA